jgi:hypothetical protein
MDPLGDLERKLRAEFEAKRTELETRIVNLEKAHPLVMDALRALHALPEEPKPEAASANPPSPSNSPAS